MARRVILAAHVDPTTGSVKMIDYEHAEIHAGDHFYVSDFETKALDANIDLVFTTPNTSKWAHFNFKAGGTERIEVVIYEGSTEVSEGTPITPINNDRNSTKISTVSVLKDPVIVGIGTVIDRWSVGSVDPFGVPGLAKRENEIIFKQNTKYTFRITSRSAGNIISYKASWYEHTNA